MTPSIRNIETFSPNHIVFVDEFGISRTIDKTNTVWRNVNIGWKIGLVGSIFTMSGGMLLIAEIIYGDISAVSVAFTSVGLVLDVIGCYFSCKK